MRTVVIGPGKLGYTIQATKQGPMIIGCPPNQHTDSNEGSTFMDAITKQMLGNDSGSNASYRGHRAKLITGELFLGDIIVEIDKIRTDKMNGKEIVKVFNRTQKRKLRNLTVSHREGTGLAAVYQPGPYGSAAIAGVLNKAKKIEDEEFEDDGVVGAGYFNMGWFS